MYRFLTLNLLNPSVVLLGLTGLTILNLWRKRVESRRRLCLATVAFLGLYAACTPGVAFLALGSLEDWYTPQYELPADAQAIVVLGGYVRRDDHRRRAELGTFSLYRCLHALQLYRQRPLPMVLSGGKNADGLGPTQAAAMSRFLREQGVRPEDILLEERSQTTYENAVESARILKDRGLQRVVLVTDAIHLLRAELCFEKLGIVTYPQGTYYQATSPPPLGETLLPSANAASDMERVAHEWLGLAWYRLQGRI